MADRQTTIARSVTLKGTGLHSGQAVTMKLLPAEANRGIRFRRSDLEGKPEIKAEADWVVDVSRGTTLEYQGARVATVEHLLAAVAGLGIDNLLVDLNAVEVPIMDGSSAPFVRALTRAGLVQQDAERDYFELQEVMRYSDAERGVEIIALPSERFEVDCMIDFDSPVLGQQHARLEGHAAFAESFADARTFCFLHELQQLYDARLIRGGDLNNALVIVDRVVQEDELDRLRTMFNKRDVKVRLNTYLNGKKLRYPNEPARHKVLDIVGDLALAGKPIKARIIATRPGHAANVAFARMLRERIRESKFRVDVPHYDPNKAPVYDINQIQQLLPHRYPILLVDKIIHADDQVVVGVKNVTMNEAFFQGHFPDHPIMPGVLQIEAMAQTGGILVMNQYPDPENYETLFLRIDKARFKRPVVPGDTLIMKMELLSPIRRGLCEMRATAFVGNQIATEAELVAQVRKKPGRA
jgi:UDP-3-O-[3-hydroxymyristoyl] N-acetylglucosamine deacetylase/3-hydroxyacyl-[acyl-carrier-protein] dehydratase